MSPKKRDRKAGRTAPNNSNDDSPEEIQRGDSLTYHRWIRSHWIVVCILVVAALGVFGSAIRSIRNDRISPAESDTSAKSVVSRLSPFAPEPPSVQLSKEYIYAGERLLAVEDANAMAIPPADLAVWRSGDGNWYVMGGQNSAPTTYNWGSPGDKPAAGDYDGDGKTDFAIYRPTAPTSFYVVRSSDGSTTTYQFGVPGDVPAPADYDGDGKTDFALYRPSDGSWYVSTSTSGSLIYPNVGVAGGLPAPADYDGDGRADATVLVGSNYTTRLTNNYQLTTIAMGYSGTPVSGDYDGDGKANYAVRNGANWVIMNAALSGTSTSTPAGDLSTDIPVPNDYDGDGKCDIATFRASPQGVWYIRQSSNGQTRTEQWGYAGDIPVPALFRR